MDNCSSWLAIRQSMPEESATCVFLSGFDQKTRRKITEKKDFKGLTSISLIRIRFYQMRRYLCDFVIKPSFSRGYVIAGFVVVSY